LEKGILAGKKFTLQKSEFTLQRRLFGFKCLYSRTEEKQRDNFGIP
jgi:hypothetical protein